MRTELKAKDQSKHIRALLVELDWTESDAWILMSELPETFGGTLTKKMATIESLSSDEAAVLIRELELLLAQ